MRVVYFTHSLRSCWNHGNAHFLRGVLRELVLAGHEVRVYEPEGAWSLANLLRDHGPGGLSPFERAYPELRSEAFGPDLDLDRALDGADAVLVHEWNEPALVAAVGARRRAGGRFRLLFHDTHHRAASDPAAMRAFDLDGYDAVLAFGETVSAVYRRWGWGERVFTWHEAADTRLFHPLPPAPHAEERLQAASRSTRDRGASFEARLRRAPQDEEVGWFRPASQDEKGGSGAAVRHGLVWIGNWGDDERSRELEEFLFRPAAALGLPLDVYGVRYPDAALDTLRRHGARYHGWAPNAEAPAIFARHLATVHVPRRFYVDVLPGVPTIRVFEALACGIPLVSAPWRDSEELFRVGTDFLMARDPADTERLLRAVRDDADLRASLAAHGLETIRSRHTCRHRAEELMTILARLNGERIPANAA